jgi:hypothetical protein
VEVTVTTFHHPGSDHRGVLYSWSARAPLREEPPLPPLPHRAFELKEVIAYNRVILQEYVENHLKGPNDFPKRDKAKRLMHTHTIEAWDKKVRARGKHLKAIAKRCTKLRIDLHRMPINHLCRGPTITALTNSTRALQVATSKDMAMRKEAIQAKWIQMSGKPNKDFLAKPIGARKRIGNMMIDNVKDLPDLPRTDDMGVILQNFVEYYSKLYEHKAICPVALDRLIANLTLTLDEEEAKELDEPISSKELLAAIVDSPKGKSPGTDRLPYECYKANPNESATILAAIGNLVPDKGTQPQSWTQIIISVLPKEADSYSTHKFRPISLLNTDYKLVMRVWANRLGPILARKIGHHQRGFIPERDGRENIINVQMIIDMINAKNEEGAVTFLDQEKAFDMVSFTTINTVFAKLNWPERFRAMLSTTYRSNHIWAKVKANGITSKNDFPVNSGTRQGCPLSPLIYTIVADLYNMSIINHKCFKGHETLLGQFVKISAYADDTAVHLGALADIKIYRQYSLATGGVTNFHKSEGVLCGTWRTSEPDLGINNVKGSKYLGVITGCDSTLASKAYLGIWG